MNVYSSKRHQSGVTLVELMVALVVSSILLLGVAKIYSTTKRSSKVNNDFAVLQEEGRIALNYLVRDIRMAGYLGCAYNNGNSTQFQCYLDTTKNNHYICSSAAIPSIDGYDYAGTNATKSYTLTVDSSTPPKLDTGAASDWTNNKEANLPSSFPVVDAVAGSDVIVVQHGEGTSFPLKSDAATLLQIDVSDVTTSTSSSKTCNGATGICANDIMVISDCSKARVFQVTSLASPGAPLLSINHNKGGSLIPGNSTGSWDVSTGGTDDFSNTDSEIMEYRTWAYYVANNANGEPALYRHDGISGDAAQELVEGVENMQILYGIDKNNDGTANYYASADDVDFTDISKPVVSVRISLLVRSKNQIPNRGANSKSYPLATTSITNAKDQRLRKIFTTTIKIRNKGGSL